MGKAVEDKNIKNKNTTKVLSNNICKYDHTEQQRNGSKIVKEYFHDLIRMVQDPLIKNKVRDSIKYTCIYVK